MSENDTAPHTDDPPLNIHKNLPESLNFEDNNFTLILPDSSLNLIAKTPSSNLQIPCAVTQVIQHDAAKFCNNPPIPANQTALDPVLQDEDLHILLEKIDGIFDKMETLHKKIDTNLTTLNNKMKECHNSFKTGEEESSKPGGEDITHNESTTNAIADNNKNNTIDGTDEVNCGVTMLLSFFRRYCNKLNNCIPLDPPAPHISDIIPCYVVTLDPSETCIFHCLNTVSTTFFDAVSISDDSTDNMNIPVNRHALDPFVSCISPTVNIVINFNFDNNSFEHYRDGFNDGFWDGTHYISDDPDDSNIYDGMEDDDYDGGDGEYFHDDNFCEDDEDDPAEVIRYIEENVFKSDDEYFDDGYSHDCGGPYDDDYYDEH